MISKLKAGLGWFASRITSHKKTALIFVIALGVCVYGALSLFGGDEASVRTISATAKRGVVESKVSGSGQVSALSQVDVTSTVSGDIEYVGVVAGQEVVAGQTLARIESADAVKAVSNAELAVANAQISYDKALKQKNNQAETSSVSDIKKAYENGYDTITGVFIDLPAIFMEVSDIFYVPTHSPYFSDKEISYLLGGSSALEYKYQAGQLFDKAKAEYDQVFSTYKSLSASSDPESIEGFLDTTYGLLRNLSAALSGTYNTIDFINARLQSSPSQLSADKSQLSSYISKVNSAISNVSKAQTSIEDAKDSATSAELSLKSAELELSQKEDALRDAREDLANHTIVSPFDGIVSKVNVEKGDKASSNTSVATVITKSQNVALSFNEVDAAKLKVGQKATLTFDAIDDLTLTGTISEIDVVGTVSQGVVSYGAKIRFDTNDERVKPGMTVSASIVSDSRANVISVPSSAIRTQGNQSFIELVDRGLVPVTLGLSGDEATEVISGLSEGDRYIVSTITVSSNQSTQSSAASLFGGAGATRAFTGGTRTVSAPAGGASVVR